MKTLIAALVLSAFSAPVMAMDDTVAMPFLGLYGDSTVTTDDLGRRSGRCVKRAVAREGSVCGGV